MRAYLKASRGLLLFVVLYAILRSALGFSSSAHGLLSPDGQIDPIAASFTLAVLTMRLGLLFLIAPILVFRMIRRALPS